MHGDFAHAVDLRNAARYEHRPLERSRGTGDFPNLRPIHVHTYTGGMRRAGFVPQNRGELRWGGVRTNSQSREFFRTREWPSLLTLQSLAPDCWLVASSAARLHQVAGISIAIDRPNPGACRLDDWIGHFVEEERQRERVRLLETAFEAQEVENAALHVRRLMASLGARVSGDVENFARAFPERRLSYEGHPGGGFTVRRGVDRILRLAAVSPVALD